MALDTPAAHPGVLPDVFRAFLLLACLGSWLGQENPEEATDANPAGYVKQNLDDLLDELSQNLIRGIINGFPPEVPRGEAIHQSLHRGLGF